MYSPRRRKYYSKKNYRNRLFAPSMKKANIPNYYQMKGRIIQQSPSNIQNSASELITREKLKKMYDTLIRFKYPGVGTTPFDPTPFTFFFYTPAITFNNLGDHTDFNELYFQNLVDATEKPALPSGYTYAFDVIGIKFGAGPVTNDASQFNFTWNNNLITGFPERSIITKGTTLTLSAENITILTVEPRFVHLATIEYITFLTTMMNIDEDTLPSTDSSANDKVFYSFVTSNNTNITYGSSITYECTSTSEYLRNYAISFVVLLYSKPINN